MYETVEWVCNPRDALEKKIVVNIAYPPRAGFRVSSDCARCVCVSALVCVYFPSGGEATLRLAGKALNAVCHSHIESYKA